MKKKKQGYLEYAHIYSCVCCLGFLILKVSFYNVTKGCLIKIAAAKCWNVPDSLGIERTGAIEDLKLILSTDLVQQSVTGNKQFLAFLNNSVCQSVIASQLQK